MKAMKADLHNLLSRAFWDGYGRVLDLGGTSKQWPDLLNDREKDYEALRRDWSHVGESIGESISEYGVECARPGNE